MNTLSNLTRTKVVPMPSSPKRNRITLLLQMAREAEQLAAQAERIRELRKLSRKTGEFVAAQVGVTYRTYQRWESAAGGEISPTNLAKLAAYFGSTPDFIEYGPVERGETPDPFPSTNGTIESQLADIKQELADIKASQLALVGDLREIRKALQSLARARRSQAS